MLKRTIFVCCLFLVCVPLRAKEPTIKELRERVRIDLATERANLYRAAVSNLAEFERKNGRMQPVWEREIIDSEVQKTELENYIRNLGANIDNCHDNEFDLVALKSATDRLAMSTSEGQFLSREKTFINIYSLHYFYIGLYPWKHYHPGPREMLSSGWTKPDQIYPGWICGSRGEFEECLNIVRSHLRSVHLALVNLGRIKVGK